MKFLTFILIGMIVFSCYSSNSTHESKKQDKHQMVDLTKSQSEIDEKLILDYLKSNNLDAKSTASGIYYVMENEGTGELPNPNQNFTVHYHGYLLDGTVFDSSVKRGKPISFALSRVIRGWQEAIPMLKKGGKGKFVFPSKLAYGARAMGKIPSNSVLVFDIELVDFH